MGTAEHGRCMLDKFTSAKDSNACGAYLRRQTVKTPLPVTIDYSQNGDSNHRSPIHLVSDTTTDN